MITQTLGKNISRETGSFATAESALNGLRTVAARIIHSMGTLIAYSVVAVVMAGAFCASILSDPIVGKDIA